jgi:hypothetical protein
MMLLPGCSAGSAISPKPASGPLFIQRRSLAIFMRLTLNDLELSRQFHRRILARERLEIIAAGREGDPGVRGQVPGNGRTEFGVAR